jgi:homoserine kinase
MNEVSVFAPSSIGNIGPGFDLLGMAIAGMGDRVIAKRVRKPGVVITEIIGASLSLRSDENTAGIAATAVQSHLRVKGGVSLRLYKGVPGTGLGSSAASAVAAAYATNLLFGGKLTREELIPLAAIAEAKVSGGFFLDNIGPSMMGGITWNNPFTREVIRLGTLEEAIVVVATPDFPLLTRESRKRLPKAITMEQFVSNMAYASIMAWAVSKKDLTRFGQSIQDRVAEPARAPLIKGFDDAKKEALTAGALGVSIAGAGASVFAIADNPKKARAVCAAMEEGFKKNEVVATTRITKIDRKGVRQT